MQDNLQRGTFISLDLLGNHYARMARGNSICFVGQLSLRSVLSRYHRLLRKTRRVARGHAADPPDTPYPLLRDPWAVDFSRRRAIMPSISRYIIYPRPL